MAEEEVFTQEVETAAETTTRPGGLAALFSIEGILFLTVALLFDIVGIILTLVDIGVATAVVGEGISWISDLLGLLIFGFWMLCRWLWFKGQAGAQPGEILRPKEMAQQRRKAIEEIGQKSQKAVAKAKKIAQSGAKAATKAVRFSRLVFAFIAEIIPILGALPCWTILVYSEMKKNGPMFI
jgi:hypothetical protein